MTNVSNISSIDPVSVQDGTVQNGTQILTPEILTYVQRYRGFAKQTADSIIGLALTLAEAEENLNRVDFTLFCDEVGVDPNGATYRKLKAIAVNSARFSPIMDCLPAAWTTIYKLATLSSADFDRLVSEKVISPYLSAGKITEALNGPKAEKSEGAKEPDFTISVANLTPEDKAAVYDIVFKLQSEFHCSIAPNRALENEIIAFRRQQAA